MVDQIHARKSRNCQRRQKKTLRKIKALKSEIQGA